MDDQWSGGPGRLSPGPPQLYLLLIAGHVLVTLREAFAVAPGAGAARVVAVRRTGPGIVLNRKRGRVFPVDLSTEPEIRDLLSALDTSDPATEN